MARLSRQRCRTDDRDRAQLLLIGAFGVAVLLLVMAGVANTVTYTAVTDDREHPTSRDLAAFQEDLRRGVEGIRERVNEGSESYGARVRQFADSVDGWGAVTDREHLRDATGVTVTVEETTEGSRITQTAEGRPLTNAEGDGDWTLVESTDETRSFTLELDRESLTEEPCAEACFELAVDGEVVSVSQSAVTGSTGRCDIDSDPVRIDAVDGTLDGEECAALDDIEQAQEEGDSDRIQYRNGENASGTYRIVVRGSVPDDEDYSDGQPSVTPIIYSAEVGFDYRSPRLTYANVVTVEGDDG